MSTVPPIAHRKLWEERSVAVALILAILVPGLGHLFQGRFLKGLIYLFGILGLFFWGVKLGEGVVCYNSPEQGVRGITRKITLHFAAQFGAGVVSYPAFWQQSRVLKNNHPLMQLDQPLTAPFSGLLKNSENEPDGRALQGTVHLAPESGEYGTETKGTFVGTLDGTPIELKLAGGFFLDKPVAAGFRRVMKSGVASEKRGASGGGQIIVGSIPRSLIDSYGVPPDLDQLQELTGRLGKLHELALVFTWIAGLLNILAIWDCVQGPAYGFGDESLSPTQDSNSATENNAAAATPHSSQLGKSVNPA